MCRKQNSSCKRSETLDTGYKTGSKTNFWILGIVIIFLSLFVIGCLYIVCQMKQEIYEIQQDLNTMNLHNQSATQSEYTQTIDFLENEFVKYRELVENQQDYLTWLLGLVGTGLIGLFAFLGIKERKDISNILREQYTNHVQEEIARFIGGQNKVTYLNNSIEKEEQAKSKKILFLLQHSENRNLIHVYQILQNEKYKVDIASIEDENIDECVKMYDIIVCQVAESENEASQKAENESEEKKTSSEKKQTVYSMISEKCKSQRKYVILYCENVKLASGSYTPSFYISIANYSSTLMERIYNLLYFV